MSIIPIDNEHIMVMMQNDAQQMRTFISWLQERNITYQQKMSTQNMTAAGVSESDQNAILTFMADVGRLTSYVQGTPQAVAGDIRIDITGILGVM